MESLPPLPSRRSDPDYWRDEAGSDIVGAARQRAMAALTGAAETDEEKGPAAAAVAKGESQTAVAQDGGPTRRSARLSTYGGEPASAARAKGGSKTCGAITKNLKLRPEQPTEDPKPTLARRKARGN